MLKLFRMADLKNAYGTYYNQSNATLTKQTNWFDFGKTQYTEIPHEMYQDHKPYSTNNDYDVGLRGVFANNLTNEDYSQEPVGEVFFSEKNVKRLQKQIKDEIFMRTKGKFILEEDQDANDLIIAMRGVYKMYGKFMNSRIVHQVKELNKRLVNFVVPDMITEMKQYYGYQKDINEPLKPIDRPVNVSNAGRRTLPSISTIWSQH